MTKHEFVAGVSRLVVRYGHAFPTVQLEAWYADLKEMPAGKFSYLVGLFLREVPTWPWKVNLPAKLRRLEKDWPYSPPARPFAEEKWEPMTKQERQKWIMVKDRLTMKMQVKEED